MINEIVGLAKNQSGRKCLIFKVDFEKAYVSVNWNFLRYCCTDLDSMKGQNLGFVLVSFLEACRY